MNDITQQEHATAHPRRQIIGQLLVDFVCLEMVEDFTPADAPQACLIHTMRRPLYFYISY